MRGIRAPEWEGQNPLPIEWMKVTPVIRAPGSFHAAHRRTDQLYRMQIALRRSLEAQDFLNP